MEHANAAHISWNFTLRLPIEVETPNVKGWVSPSLDQLKEWGYEQMEKSEADSTQEVVVLAKGVELQSNSDEESKEAGQQLEGTQGGSPLMGKTRVQLITHEHSNLHQYFSEEEVALLTQEQNTTGKQDKPSEKSVTLLAQRHVEGSFDPCISVSLVQIQIGRKNTCIMERFPAIIDVDGSMTITVCRALTESALEAILRTAIVYFKTWAAHEAQIDKLENSGLDILSCKYELHVVLADSPETKQGWFRPTADTSKKLGYETLERGSNNTLILSSN